MNATTLIATLKKEGTEKLDSCLEQATVALLKNAVWRAKKDLDLDVVPALKAKLDTFGGQSTPTAAAKDIKDYPKQLTVVMDKQYDGMFNDLVIAACNKAGCFVSTETKENKTTVVYGFKKDDAKRIQEKFGAMKELEIKEVQGTPKK